VRDQRIEGLILIEPLGCGLWTHSSDARNIVRTVAHQREVGDDLFWKHVELRLDAVAIETSVAHGVDQSHLRAHQLSHVFIAGRDQDLISPLRSLLGQSADDIVRFDAGDTQQRQPHRDDDVQQGLYLRAQIVRHGCAMRFVLIEQIVSECTAGGIEHHGDAIGRLLLDHLVQHVQHAQDRPGRLPLGVGERRQCMEGSIQIRGTVDQDEFARAHGPYPI
jgi:hypothetical protein